MTLREPPVGDGSLDAECKIQEPQRVGHGRASPPDPPGQVVLGEPELFDELAVGVGCLDRIEVLPLEVLHEGKFQLVPVGELPDDRGDPIEPGSLRRTQATLPRHQLVAVDRFRHQDGLDDPVLGNARRERGEAGRIESLAWLMRIRTNTGGGDLEDGGLAGRPLRDERCETAAQSLGSRRSDGHEATTASRISSRAVPLPSRTRSSSARAAYARAPVESGE